MDSGSGSDQRDHLTKRSITTRRGFIAGASLGALSLYGLWVAYGTAPFGLDMSGTEEMASGHGGEHGAAHGAEAAPSGHAEHGAAAGPPPEAFQREAEEFIERHRLADGSVQPDPGSDAASGGAMAGHSHAASGHQAMPAHGDAAAPAQSGGAPVDVYLLAQRFSFDPPILRLRAGSSYRLRMMAVDVSHGASFQLGGASQIIRLRPSIVVDRLVTFTRPGEYLIYCTVYCGPGHDRMSAKLIVA
jgi:cytochrome c oxidase subunit II